MLPAPRIVFFAVAAICGASAAQVPYAHAQSSASGSVNAGRIRLTRSLDAIASQYTARRSASVTQISTRSEAEARQAEVRRKIQGLIGQLPERTPLNAQVTGETHTDGFSIRKVVFESQPGFRVTGLVYLPVGQKPSGKHPAILMTPGHYPTSKAYDAGTAALFALNGFVVFSYDPIGMGERIEYPDPTHAGATLARGPTGEHGEASLQPLLAGDTLARYMLWDAMRGVDYLSSLPEVDAKRIGAFGCSGGGAVSALLGALDSRVAAVGVACYITSFDALLPALGPQEAEQSDPGFIAAGLDFPDWVELAAPRPYAVVSTYDDMFPFAGTRVSVAEARRYYSLFDAASAGTPDPGASAGMPPIPSGPAWNIDTNNRISPDARLQFITGPGKHGALAPVMREILSFFLRNLQPGSDADHPKIPAEYLTAGPQNPVTRLPASTFQVTSTGQVLSSYADEATVASLNKTRTEQLAATRSALNGEALRAAIRSITGAEAKSGGSKYSPELLNVKSGSLTLGENGNAVEAEIRAPTGTGRHPAVLLLVPDSIEGNNEIARANKAKFDALVAAGSVVLAITPRPLPSGTDDMKAPILGPFYLLSLRAENLNKTLLGLRADDAIRAIDYLSSRNDVDPSQISAMGSGHMGLVLLYIAVLDARLKHITVDHVLTSYQSLVDARMPVGAAEDIVPGVLRHYDIPDLKRTLGPRLTATSWLDGADDLSQTSTPLKSLAGGQE